MSEALVLSNALGTTRELWNRQVPALESRFRLLRYEHRGRDSVEALAGDVLELLDVEGVERASFCGVSLGGAVGMWLAANAPERIDRLVLSSTSARFGPSEMWYERAELVRRAGTAPLADATMDRWFTPRFQDREPFRRMLLETPRDDYAACCEAIAKWDFRNELTKISAPTLVVAGAEDPSTPPEHAQLIAEQIPGAELVVLPEAAHLANVEQSDAFNAAVTNHLGGERMSEDGMKMRREVLGDEHVDRAIANTTEFTADFQDLITRYAWGEIWTRPGLDRRTRSCITITALVASGREHELALHVRAALRNGLSPNELKEVLLQCAVYCGVPAANGAFAIAQQVLEEEER